MPISTDAEVVDAIAALDKRFQAMDALCSILEGHLDSQRRDLRALQSTLRAADDREGKLVGGTPGEISADMLE